MAILNIVAAIIGSGSGTSGGVTDNSPIINALISGGAKGAVFEPGTYLFNTTVVFPDDWAFIGSGRGVTNIVFAGTGPAFTLGNRNLVAGMTIDGTLSSANRKGIYWTDTYENTIQDVLFKNLKWGAFWEGNLSAFKTSTLVNCYAQDCATGFHSDIRGEYVTIQNCNANGCDKAAYIAGGNTKIISGNMTGNTKGIHLASGSNHAHSLISGVTTNHNTDYGLFVDAVTLGMKITGCSFQAAPVLIQTSSRIHFNENIVDADIVLDNSSTCQVRNNLMLASAVVSQINGATGNDTGNNN